MNGTTWQRDLSLIKTFSSGECSFPHSLQTHTHTYTPSLGGRAGLKAGAVVWCGTFAAVVKELPSVPVLGGPLDAPAGLLVPTLVTTDGN